MEQSRRAYDDPTAGRTGRESPEYWYINADLQVEEWKSTRKRREKKLTLAGSEQGYPPLFGTLLEVDQNVWRVD